MPVKNLFGDCRMRSITNLRQLGKESSFYAIGAFLPKISWFLCLPIITGLISPSEFGIYSTLTSTVNFLTPLLILGGGAAVSRQFYDNIDDLAQFRSYAGSVWTSVFIIATTVIGTCIAFWGDSAWSRVIPSIPFSPCVIIALLTCWVNVISLRFWAPTFQARRLPLAYASIEACNGFVALLALLFLVYWWQNSALAMLTGGFIGASSAGILTFVFLRGSFPRLQLKVAHLQSAAAFGLPLVPHLINHWILSLSDRIVIVRLCRIEDVGFYSLAANLVLALQVLIQSVANAFAPHYYRWMGSSDGRAEEKLVPYVTAWFLCIGTLELIGGMFAKEFMIVLVDEKYMPAEPFIPWLGLGALVSACVAAQLGTEFCTHTQIWCRIRCGYNGYFISMSGNSIPFCSLENPKGEISVFAFRIDYLTSCVGLRVVSL